VCLSKVLGVSVTAVTREVATANGRFNSASSPYARAQSHCQDAAKARGLLGWVTKPILLRTAPVGRVTRGAKTGLPVDQPFTATRGDWAGCTEPVIAAPLGAFKLPHKAMDLSPDVFEDCMQSKLSVTGWSSRHKTFSHVRSRLHHPNCPQPVRSAHISCI